MVPRVSPSLPQRISTVLYENKTLAFALLIISGAVLFYIARSLIGRVNAARNEMALMYFDLGMKSALNKDYQGAAGYYKTALSYQPTDVDLKASIHIALGRVSSIPEETIACCTTAISLTQDKNLLSYAYMYRGEARAAESQYTEALEDLRIAMAFNDSETKGEILLIMSQVHHLQKNHDLAIEKWKEAFSCHPNRRECLKILAGFYEGCIKTKNPEQGHKYIDVVLDWMKDKKDQWYASVLHFKSQVQIGLNQYDKALHNSSLALTCTLSGPDQKAKILLRRSEIYEFLNRFEDAKKDLEAALACGSKDADLLSTIRERLDTPD